MRLFHRYSAFLRDVATLATGRGASMAIKLALTPVIARLFTPSDFGVLAFFGSVVAVASAFATLRYERAIVLAPDEAEAGRLAQLTATVLGLSTTLMMVIAIGVLWLEPEAETFQRLGGWLLVVPLALALTGIMQIIEGVLSRRGHFAPIAFGDIGQVSATSLSRVALGVLAGSSVWALMVSYVFGLATRIGILVKSVGDTLPRLRDAQRETLVTTAKAYRDFPLHNAPTGFLRDLSNTLPVFALTFVFTPAVAGFYSMANRLVWMPINTASTALRRVLTQRLAKYHKAGWGMMQPALLVTGGMAMVGAVPFGLLWLYAERVTPWLLGDQWVQAGQYVAVLTPLFFVGFLTRPTGTLYVVLRRQALGLRIQIGIVLARVSVFAHAFLNDLDVLSTLANFVYVSIAGNAVIFATGIWLAWRHDRQASGEPTAGLPD